MSHAQLIANPNTRKGIRQYDHTDFYPTIRPTDLFICTYLKSGTHWLGYLIAQMLKSQPDEVLNLDSFHKYVPEVNLLWTKRGSLKQYDQLPNPRCFLMHAAYDPVLPRVVYMLRDPRDVMVSYWHYRQFMDKTFNLSLADYLRSGDHWPCEWDEHVTSWLLPRRHSNLLVVKYEDMHKDTAAVLRNVLNFAGIPHTESLIDTAVEASGFERMRAVEEKFGVSSKAGRDEERFIRKGRIGSWQEEMGYTELSILEERYGNVMRAVGYEPLS